MFGFFKKKNPETLLDQLNASTVEMFKPILVNKKHLSDEKIIEIVQTVMRAFKEAAESKGETISGTVLINISAKFIKVFDISEPEFFMAERRVPKMSKGCFLYVDCLFFTKYSFS
jgi:hypothetical protein